MLRVVKELDGLFLIKPFRSFVNHETKVLFALKNMVSAIRHLTPTPSNFGFNGDRILYIPHMLEGCFLFIENACDSRNLFHLELSGLVFRVLQLLLGLVALLLSFPERLRPFDGILRRRSCAV